MILTDKDKSDICINFAPHIKRIRKEMHLSQRLFGELVGASKERINAIENGRAIMRWSLLCSILFYCFSNLKSKNFILQQHMLDPRVLRYLQFKSENSYPDININSDYAGTYVEWLKP